MRVVTDIGEIEEIRSFWEAHQSFADADIDSYLFDLQYRTDIIRPHILVLMKSQQIIGLIVARLVRRPLDLRIGYFRVLKRPIRFLEIPFGGVLGDLTKEGCEQLLATLLESLFKSNCPFALFNYIDVGSSLHRTLRHRTGRFSKDPLGELYPRWTLELSGTFHAFLDSRSKNTKINVRQSRRRLAKKFGDKLSIVCYRSVDEVDKALNTADCIAAQTYHRRIGVGLPATPEIRDQWKFAAERNRLRVHVLEANGEPIAFWAGLVYAKSYLVSYTGFDPELKYERPGTFLLIKMIEEFYADESVEMVDYGFGYSDYKRRLGSNESLVARQFVFASTGQALGLRLLCGLISRVNDIAKGALERLKLSKRIKRVLRS